MTAEELGVDRERSTARTEAPAPTPPFPRKLLWRAVFPAGTTREAIDTVWLMLGEMEAAKNAARVLGYACSVKTSDSDLCLYGVPAYATTDPEGVAEKANEL